MTSKYYNYLNNDNLVQCFSKIQQKKNPPLGEKLKSLTQGFVKEFDIINECGIIKNKVDGEEFLITPETFFYNKDGITILSLYPGENVLFEHSKLNNIMIAINVFSCDGNEDIRNRLEEEAWEKYYDEYGDCIWCGTCCHNGNHEY